MVSIITYLSFPVRWRLPSRCELNSNKEVEINWRTKCARRTFENEHFNMQNTSLKPIGKADQYRKINESDFKPLKRCLRVLCWCIVELYFRSLQMQAVERPRNNHDFNRSHIDMCFVKGKGFNALRFESSSWGLSLHMWVYFKTKKTSISTKL